MKYITTFIFSVFTCTHLLAFDALQFGLVRFADSKPYKSVKSEAQFFPYIHAEYGMFYLDGLDIGATFWETQEMSAKLGFSYGTYGYRAKDGYFLRGMATRKPSVDMDVQLGLEVSKLSKISLRLSQDISSKHKGFSGIAIYERVFIQEEDYNFNMFLKGEYLSGIKTNYYYGVKSSEATDSRQAYKPKSVLNASMGVRGLYQIAPKWALLVGAECVFLDSEIYNSPIVNDKSEISGYLGFLYTFY